MARIRKATRAKSNVLPEPENHEEEGKDKEEKEAAKEKEKEEEKEKYIQGKEMGKAKAETEEEEEGEGERQVEGEVEAASTNSMGQDQRSVEQGTLLLSYHNGTNFNSLHIKGCDSSEDSEEEEEEEEDDAARTSSTGQDQRSVEQGKDNMDAFRAQLAELGLRIVDITGDGNCLFRALSDQLCGDQESHAEYRQTVVQYLVSYPEEFAGFFSEGNAGSFEEYYTKMSKDAEWGGNLELYAASKAFYMNIRVYRFDQGQLAVSEINNFDDAGTLLLSYHNGTHYNSLHIKGCDNSEDEERADYKTKEKMKDSEEHDNDSVELITSATGYTGADLIRSELQLVDGDTAAAVDMILEELTSTMDSAKNDEGEIVDPPCINNDSQRNSRKRKYTQMKRKTRRVMRITIATAAKKA
ncbi:OVARIAN TUMOR DOMAIN-containing deubiquitinating enzyme 7 isoform X2 [Cryptomeria japonica]|uniref:OVARIAN TUMOR DOMAIN-containing deubiquitinating enzyme 7 isoform X2 n=1 Tax=Cryptomeria japonica TaxID=3369 RepID=UPI0027D9E900|nr:OVARIAN TUMOR DOMAIN-containing deubiquitinating enzyme 7 isoform X2 [Cryptomeria japonica]